MPHRNNSKLSFPIFDLAECRRVGKQQALAPLASPTVCCKISEMAWQKMVGDKLAKARFYPPYYQRRERHLMVYTPTVSRFGVSHGSPRRNRG